MYRELHYDDIDRFNADFSGVLDMEARQLRPGGVGGRRSVELPGLTAHLFYHDADIHIQEVATSDALLMGSLLAADRPANWLGRELGSEEVVTQEQGHGYDYILSAGSIGYLLEVSPEIADSLGWRAGQTPSFIAPRKALRDYHRVAGLAVDLGRSWSAAPVDPRDVMALRDGLLKRASAMFGQPVARRQFGGRSYELVKAAERCVDRKKPDMPVVVSVLAASMGVAERTLRHAFETWAGMGPLKYFAVRRLHEFRKTMLSGQRGRGLIKESAAQHGYTHLGQLSADYRKHFGESPSETLRRKGT